MKRNNSVAYNTFKGKMLYDVKLLVKDHKRLIKKDKNSQKSTVGRKNLGHITRSGIVMLHAAAQTYFRELAEEMMNRIGKEVVNRQQLPYRILLLYYEHVYNEMKKGDSKKIKADRIHVVSEALLKTSENDWKKYFSSYIVNIKKDKIVRFSSIKFNQIYKLFDTCMSIEYSDLFSGCDEIDAGTNKSESKVKQQVKKSQEVVDEFDDLRHEIAHKGKKAGYPQIRNLKSYLNVIENFVSRVDQNVMNHISNLTTTKVTASGKNSQDKRQLHVLQQIDKLQKLRGKRNP